MLAFFIEKIMKDDSTKSVNKKIEELKTLSNIINILNSRKKGNYNTNILSTKGNEPEHAHKHNLSDNDNNKTSHSINKTNHSIVNHSLLKENQKLISNITEQPLNMVNNATNTNNSHSNLNDSLKELNDLSAQLLLRNQTNFLNPFALLPSFPLSPLSLNLFPQNALQSNSTNLQQLLLLGNNLGMNTLNPFINIDNSTSNNNNNTLLMLINCLSQMNKN